MHPFPGSVLTDRTSSVTSERLTKGFWLINLKLMHIPMPANLCRWWRWWYWERSLRVRVRREGNRMGSRRHGTVLIPNSKCKSLI